MAETLYFSSLHLIVDGGWPNKKFLNKAFSEEKMQYPQEDFTHKIQRESINSRFYWFYSHYGKAMPRPDFLLDSESGEESKNPRTKTQVEPTGQLFAIYDSDSRMLYISNLNKKTFLENFLFQFAEESVNIKNIFKSRDEFLAIITKLDGISFTSKRNIFNANNDAVTGKSSIFAHLAPEKLRISVDMDYGTRAKKTIEKIVRQLYEHKNAGELDTLICRGEDEDGIATIFNAESLTSKITISLTRSEEHLFSSEEVKEKIITELTNLSHV